MKNETAEQITLLEDVKTTNNSKTMKELKNEAQGAMLCKIVLLKNKISNLNIEKSELEDLLFLLEKIEELCLSYAELKVN